ncbi:type III polyketide synthase [Dyadobacter sp. CY345]|uniref:type III polyketide synthase n=1 Tax=Dyadobacter sp. CY345 TaxID=2909335 RepID=UPI001F2D4142|nr:type III polyketide synthase [Dyadobacter sp. CY345]MCF2443804.1 type III polyketide synthase [Dyadobacter sp. CY345]
MSTFYMNSTNDELSQRKIKIVSAKTGIESRYSVVKDFEEDVKEIELFDQYFMGELGLSERMQVYKKYATELSIKAVRKIENFDQRKHGITHLITVTCTGLFAPGLDIEMIRELDLNPATQRSSINFMGCNAAIIALKSADAICRSLADANVLIVCTELCTIHFQKRFNDDYLLSNLIFGDGSAAVILSSQPNQEFSEKKIQVNRFDSMILHNGYRDMAWQLSETGFIMNLTSYVPGLIKENILPMLDKIRLSPSSIAHWAIHPGGKKIVDDFALALGLDKSSLSETYEVLKNYGNMSSPTVLFVLKKVLDKAEQANLGEKIFTAAFGPGLSIETMQLQYV